MGARQRPTDGAARQGLKQVGGLTAREIYEVGLADSLGGVRIVGVASIADEDRLHLRTKTRELTHAHRRPSLEDRLTVGVRRSRQDRHPRSRDPGRAEQIRIEGGYRRNE